MTRDAFSPPRRIRLGTAVVVVLLHVALILALIRAFAPDFSAQVTEKVLGVVTVTVTTAPPTSSPSPDAEPKQAARSGAAGEAGKRAEAKPVAAPSPPIVIASQAAPPVAGTGNDIRAGARDTGVGSGAGGQGSGTGSGASGSGQGGGGIAAKAVKIAGEISSTRDFPAESRELRLGDHVVVALTVGVDGRVKGCRIHRASKDRKADEITCSLATERFRFRPATDVNGNAIESVYGWQQRWFAPPDRE